MQSYKSFQSSILENTQQHNLEELRTKVLRIDKLLSKWKSYLLFKFLLLEFIVRQSSDLHLHINN